jgi:O-antigen ligase
LFVGFVALAAIRLWALGAPNPTKGYAYAVWGLFVAVAVAGSLVAVLRTPAAIGRGIAVFTVAIALIALFGLLQWTVGVLGGHPPLVTQWIGSLPRINGLSYEPSYFAFSSVLALGLALAALLDEQAFLSYRMAGIGASVLTLALMLATSRSGWLGLGALTLFCLVVAYRRWPKLQRIQRQGIGAVLAAFVVGSVLLSVVRPADFIEIASRTVDVRDASSAAPRTAGMKEALRMFRDHPLWGVGLAQFGGALVEDQPTPLTPRQMDEIVTFNIYLELAAENGLVGLLIVLAGLALCARGVYLAWRRGGRELSSPAAAILVASGAVFGIVYQFNQTLFRTEVWCLLGLALAVDRLRREPV